MSVAQCVRRFLMDEDGPTAVEYAIMLAFIVLVVFATVQTLGQNAREVFDDAGNAIAP